jgi:hypothetical protein
MIGYYGRDRYGDSPYGSYPPDIGVQSATAINPTHVEVIFTAPADFSFGPMLAPSNYIISPPLTVLAVEQTVNNSVVLTTTPQTDIVYTVTVAEAQSSFGAPLDRFHTSATFTGIAPDPAYFAIATSARRVRAVFSQVMLNDTNLSNPVNYTITDLNLNAIAVVSAVPEQSINTLSVVLTLGSNLGESDFYVCTVSSNVHTLTGLHVIPPTSVFQWLAGDNQFQVPLSYFTGEVTGGFFGDPAGLVYFSPALNVSTPNSIIQVEDIDVCTTAYDTYTPPVMVDPPILYTYGGGIVATPSPDPYLLNQCVLWAPFPRNFEARFTLGISGDRNQDFYTPPVDTSCSILIKQQFALGYVALLNDPAWFLFDNLHGTSVPPTFITAKNMSPIPSGPETIIVLHVQLGGTSTFAPATATKSGLLGSSMAGNSQLFAGAGPPPVVLAQASMAGGATLRAPIDKVISAASSINGVSVVRALPGGDIPPPTVIFGSSFFNAFATVRLAVGASIHAGSNASATGNVGRGVGSSLLSSSSVTATMKAHWAANAAIAGNSAIFADATVTHKSESFPQGVAVVLAMPS